MSGRDAMLAARVRSGLEAGMVRATRGRMHLHNEVVGRPVWLHSALAGSLPLSYLHPGTTVTTFQWHMMLMGRTGPLLQLALNDASLAELGWTPSPRAELRDALAACVVAPFMPALREFFGQDLVSRLEPAPQGWPETDSWANFQFCLSSPGDSRLDVRVPARMVEPFALKLSQKLKAARNFPPTADVALPLFAGAQLQVPVRAALELREGDVLMCEESSLDAAGQIRLYVLSASARQEARYLATLRRQNGRVDHLPPGAWLDAGLLRGGGPPRVSVDVAEARLLVSSQRCRGLAVGECLGEWLEAAWLERPEVRLCGRTVATARRTTVGGRAGFEILELNRPR